MADAPLPPQPARASLVRRSNRNYEELIREYIRAAKERLEAAKRTSPSNAGPGYAQQLLPSASTTSIHQPSLVRAAPSSPLDWPLPASGVDPPQRTPQPSKHEPQNRPSAPLSTSYPQLSAIPATVETSQAYRFDPEGLSEHSTNDVMGEEDRNPFTDRAEVGGLVREASVGRSHKAVLTRIFPRSSQDHGRSGDQLSESLTRNSSRTQDQSLKDRTAEAYFLTPTAHSQLASRESAGLRPVQVTDAGYGDSVPPAQPLFLHSTFFKRPDTAASSASSPASFRFGSIPSSQRQSALGERVGSKRPPPLDLEAVKKAEARGSLTSLPDLIQRALRLASNLEKGKTSSRFGTDWFMGGSPARDSSKQHAGSSFANRSLPTTPLPAGTPGDHKWTNISAWPRSAGLQSNLRHSYIPSVDTNDMTTEKPQQKRPNRCCGMPLWVFLLILVVIVLLMVAAVLVPVFLVVIPERHQTSSGCENGAIVVQSSSGGQNCICLNSYTGPSCERADDTGCVTLNTTGIVNASVGTGIATVLETASSVYAVELDIPGLLGVLSVSNLTCASETNLITFNGLSSRALHNVRRSSATFSISVVGDATLSLRASHRDIKPHVPRSGLMTSDGIVFATSMPSVTLSSSTTSTQSSSATPTSTAAFDPSSEHVLGLARVAVLLILQETQLLSEAQSAYSTLDAYFADPTSGDAEALGLGDGWSVDLVEGRISDGDGHIYGG